MMVSRRTHCIVGSLLVLTAFCNKASAQVPAKVTAELRSGETELEKKFQEAQDVLLAAFDKRIAQTRTAPKLSPTERQDAIGALETEKAIFQKLNWIPFSPIMRSDAITYLNTIQKAEVALGRLFDKAINEQTRLKADDVAQELVADRKIALEPRVVAKWHVTSGKRQWKLVLDSNGSCVLYSNREERGSWTLDQNNLVWRMSDPRAPGGAWVDTCVIAPNGRSMKVVNNKGDRFEGKLSVDSD